MIDMGSLAGSLAEFLKSNGIRATVETYSEQYAMVSTLVGDLRINVRNDGTIRIDASLGSTDLSGIALVASTADLWLSKVEV